MLKTICLPPANSDNLPTPNASAFLASVWNFVNNGKTGFLVPRGNVEAMAQKVIELAGNKKLRQEFGNKGYERVESLFTIDHTLEEVRDFITAENGLSHK